MTHGPHHTLPGYSPDQILVDGCDECEDRGRSPSRAIDRMDARTFTIAWMRARDLGKGNVLDVSYSEAATLEILWSVQIQLEKRGVPTGTLPGHA